MVFRKGTFRKRTKKIMRKPKKYVKKNISRVVKRVLDSQVERKIYVINSVNNSISTIVGGTPTNINLMPQISHGTGQESRIGQQVKITNAHISGFVNLLPYNSVTNTLSTPVWIKMWVISSKLTSVAGFGNTTAGTGLFEAGADTVGLQGNMLDMVLPINKDAFTVYASKRINLGATYASSTGQVGTGGYYDNSKMSVPFFFSYGKHFKQQLKYNDDTAAQNGNYPYNKNCYLIFQAVYADGSTAVGPIAEYHYALKVSYTDM